MTDPQPVDLAHHGDEAAPTGGNDEMGRRRTAIRQPRHERVKSSTDYRWEELVQFARDGYNVDTHWRFEHLSPEQRHVIARQAKKAAA